MFDGAQLYLWEYSRFGSSPAPETCLKTRRSLRAVHFHPHAVPLILTAEVRFGTPGNLLNVESTIGAALAAPLCRMPTLPLPRSWIARQFIIFLEAFWLVEAVSWGSLVHDSFCACLKEKRLPEPLDAY